MATTRDNNPYQDALVQFRAVFEQIKTKSVSAGGDNGYFVKRSSMQNAEKRIRELVAEFEGQDPPQEVLQLASEIADLKASNSKAEGTIVSQEQLIKDLKATAEEAENNRRKTRGGTAGTVEALQADKAAAGKHVESLQKELSALKIEVAASQRGGDPDQVQALLDLQTTLKSSLKDAQTERKTLTDELGQVTEIAHRYESERNKASKDLKKAQQELAKLKSARAQAIKEVKVQEVPIEVKTPLVRLLLGDKGLDRLSKLDFDRRKDLQNYAYGLLETVNSSNATRTIGDLLILAIQWIKQKSYAAREALRPWLETIHADLAAGKVRAVAFYKAMLQDIVKEFKQAKKEASEKKPEWQGKKHWWFSTLLYFQNQRKRLSLGHRILWAAKRTVRAAKKLCVRVYTGFTTLFSFPRGDERHEELYEINQDEVLPEDDVPETLTVLGGD